MKKTVLFSTVLFLSTNSIAKDYLCYLHGAQGLSAYMQNKVIPALNKNGIPALAFKMKMDSNVEQRAQEFVQGFSRLIKKDSTAKCHVVGYSMGGLAARYAANHLSYEDELGLLKPLKSKILSLSTVATPHRGTPFAELLQDNYPGLIPALEVLTKFGLKKFNDPSSDQYSPPIIGISNTYYETYVLSKKELHSISTKFGYAYIHEIQTLRGLNPINDGLVPLDSMSFGEFRGSFQSSHYFMIDDLDGIEVTAQEFMEDHWRYVSNLN